MRYIVVWHDRHCDDRCFIRDTLTDAVELARQICKSQIRGNRRYVEDFVGKSDSLVFVAYYSEEEGDGVSVYLEETKVDTL